MMELKPCPFCGGEAKLQIVPPHKHTFLEKIGIDFPDCNGSTFVGCAFCTCIISADTTNEAIKAWNTRYEPPYGGSVPAGNERIKKVK